MEQQGGVFLVSLGLTQEVTHAIKHTRYNSVICEVDTRGKRIGKAGYYKNGCELTRTPKGDYEFSSWTVEDGTHVLSFWVLLDQHGKMVADKRNRVNCFSMGYMPMDQGYLDEVMLEFSPPPKWDLIEV